MTGQNQINDSRIVRALRRQEVDLRSWLNNNNLNTISNILTGLMLPYLLPGTVNGFETFPNSGNDNSSNPNLAENNSPSCPDITATSWIFSTIMLPLVFTIMWQIYCYNHNRRNNYQELLEIEIPTITTTQEQGVQDIATSNESVIDLSQVKISTQEAERITKTIILSDSKTNWSQKELKILYVMSLVWDKESASFRQLANDDATYRMITRKTLEFITQQLSIYRDFTIFDNVNEAVELYLTVSQIIKEQQQQAPLAIRNISNFFSTLYVSGCMFSVFAAIYNNSHNTILKRPWLIMPIAELMIFANGISNYLFCTKRTQILSTHILEKIFQKSDPILSTQNLPKNDSRPWLKYSSLTLLVTFAAACGLFASIINASLPFIAGYTFPRTWQETYGGFNQKIAIDLSKYLGDIFAIATLLPISLLYGTDAYELGKKIHHGIIQTHQKGIGTTLREVGHDIRCNPALYLLHLTLATIGIIRTIKLYQVVKKRDLEIFEENKWPQEIVGNLALPTVIATIPLTFNSMIITSNRLYNYIAIRNEGIKYSAEQLFMFGIIMLNAAANSFLAMSGAQNLRTFTEKLWELTSDFATGATSFAICTKYIGQTLSLETIKEFKDWVKRNEGQNIDNSDNLAMNIKTRFDTRIISSPGFQGLRHMPNTSPTQPLATPNEHHITNIKI